MDIQKVAQATLTLLNVSICSFSSLGAHNTKIHTIKILEAIIEGKVTGEKAHRYLGWAQATMCMAGIGDFITYRLINTHESLDILNR